MLDISNLKTQYTVDEGSVHAVDDVSFEMGSNTTIGLVGESGSGKTTLGKSILRLLPDNGEIVDGSIEFKGRDLLELSDKELRKVRWNEISLIPQSAMNSFDPVYTVGDQIVEVMQEHESVSREEALEKGRELFNRVGLDPERLHDYQHQLSGGQQQRAMIALALALDPSLIIADEPTTALDVITQNRVLHMISDLQDELDTSVILITHDVSVASEICDKLGILYGGRLVEFADTETILTDPRHPYTLGLQKSFPDISHGRQDLMSIPGDPPSQIDPAEECPFTPRCPFATDACTDGKPDPQWIDPGHKVECVRADEYEMMQQRFEMADAWEEIGDGNVTTGSQANVATEETDD
jgi:peptide/nickel transport system ATP-binding protein